jgi:hypothetical protein
MWEIDHGLSCLPFADDATTITVKWPGMAFHVGVPCLLFQRHDILTRLSDDCTMIPASVRQPRRLSCVELEISC